MIEAWIDRHRGRFIGPARTQSTIRDWIVVLLLVLATCGFAGALAVRLFDPLLTLVATNFGTTTAAVALLSTAFALPFGLS